MCSPYSFSACQILTFCHSPLSTYPDAKIIPWQQGKMKMALLNLHCKVWWCSRVCFTKGEKGWKTRVGQKPSSWIWQCCSCAQTSPNVTDLFLDPTPVFLNLNLTRHRWSFPKAEGHMTKRHYVDENVSCRQPIVFFPSTGESGLEVKKAWPSGLTHQLSKRETHNDRRKVWFTLFPQAKAPRADQPAAVGIGSAPGVWGSVCHCQLQGEVVGLPMVGWGKEFGPWVMHSVGFLNKDKLRTLNILKGEQQFQPKN